MESEDDWLVCGEQRVELVIREAVRMLTGRLQLHQIHDVNDTHLEVRSILTEEVDGSQSLKCRHVTATNHDDVRIAATIVAGPLPDTQPCSAVLDRLVHRQPLWSWLLTRDDYVDVVSASQAVVGNRKETVSIRRQIDANYLGLLVNHVIDEPWVLMAEPVVFLPPYV